MNLWLRALTGVCCWERSWRYVIRLRRLTLLKPGPHQQQWPSNVECYKLNDSFDNVECCFDIVAVFGNNVAGFGNNVERNFVLSTKSKQIEHVQFVSTLSKRRNFVRHCYRNRQHCNCQKRQQCRSNIRHCRKNRSTCSVRQCWFDIVASMDGALRISFPHCVLQYHYALHKLLTSRKRCKTDT